MEKKRFDLADILSAYTGRLMAPIGGLQGVLNFLHQTNLSPHQSVRASDDAMPWMLESLPWLDGLDVRLDNEVTPDNYRDKLVGYIDEFGACHDLSPIPYCDELRRDPADELRGLYPQAEIYLVPPE